MKPVLRDICRKIGLTHVADLPKGWDAFKFWHKARRVNNASTKFLNTLNSSNLIPVSDFGKRLSKFAGSNMNALWATIVLGEWFAIRFILMAWTEETFQLVRDGIDAARKCRTVSLSSDWTNLLENRAEKLKVLNDFEASVNIVIFHVKFLHMRKNQYS